MKAKFAALLAVIGLALYACGPAVAPTAPPTTAAPTAAPTATTAAPATAPAAATATPQRPSAGGGATPTPLPTLAPSAVTAAGPKYGGILRGLSPREQPWDPHLTTGGAAELRTNSGLVLGQVFTRQWPDKGKCDMPLTPDTAETWKWVEPTLFEFNIRSGIRFHDKPPVGGRELTASDVVFSLKRFGENVSGVGYIYDNIETIEDIGRYTVRIRLKEPYSGLIPEFLALYRGANLVAPEAAAGPRKDYSDPEKSWIGVGPFQFQQWLPGVKQVFTKNPSYFMAGLPYVDRLEMLSVPDQSTQVALTVGGKLEVNHRVPIPIEASLRRNAPQLEIQGCPYWAMGLNLDVRNDKPPFSDVRVRRALSMALDRQALVDTVLGGRGSVEYIVGSHHQPWSLPMAGFPPEVRRYLEYRPDEARRLLAEAGYPQGLEVTFQTTRGDGYPYTDFSEAVASQLGKAGFKVNLEWMERARYTGTVLEGDFREMAYARSGQADVVRWLQERMFSANPPAGNRSRIKDAALDALISELARATREQDQMELWKKIQIHLADQAYVFQPVNHMDLDARQPWVKSKHGHGFAQYMASLLTNIWLDR